VALTQVDIDEDALAEAMRLSGSRTKKDTVNLRCGSSLPGTAGLRLWSTTRPWQRGGVDGHQSAQ